MFKFHVVNEGHTKEYPACNTREELREQMDKAWEAGDNPEHFVVYVKTNLFTYTPPLSRLVIG